MHICLFICLYQRPYAHMRVYSILLMIIIIIIVWLYTIAKIYLGSTYMDRLIVYIVFALKQ